MRLVYTMTLSLTSIRCLERLFHDGQLLEHMFDMATKPPQKSMFEGLFYDTSQRKEAMERTESVFTLWTDLTMVY